MDQNANEEVTFSELNWSQDYTCYKCRKMIDYSFKAYYDEKKEKHIVCIDCHQPLPSKLSRKRKRPSNAGESGPQNEEGTFSELNWSPVYTCSKCRKMIDYSFKAYYDEKKDKHIVCYDCYQPLPNKLARKRKRSSNVGEMGPQRQQPLTHILNQQLQEDQENTSQGTSSHIPEQQTPIVEEDEVSLQDASCNITQQGKKSKANQQSESKIVQETKVPEMGVHSTPLPNLNPNQKLVRKGLYFWEHVFQKKDETWIGKWVKAGSLADSSEAAKIMLNCESCNADRRKRLKMVGDRAPLRSYQVDGMTNPEDLWPWEFGQCSNKDCWGAYTRSWEVWRKSGTNRYFLRHSKSKLMSKNPPEKVNTMYINLEPGSRNVYSGMATPVGQFPIFWPMFRDGDIKQKRHVYVEVESKKKLPENLLGVARSEWPPYYRENPAYIYPNRMSFQIFEEPFSARPQFFPKTLDQLEETGWPEVGRIFVFMYPGGAGCRVEQYKYLNIDRSEAPPLQDYFLYCTTPLNLPRWWPEGEKAGFVKGVKSGWAGPVISFWRRTETNSKFFSG